MKKLFTLLLALAAIAARAYNIYPVPHDQRAGGEMTFPQSVCLMADSTIDHATLARAESVLLAAGIQVSNDAPYKLILGTIGATTCPDLDPALILKPGKYDRHGIVMNGSSTTILGEHTNATFCGLASLEQILEEGAAQEAVIYDWADQQNRGIVEGYYGYPYSVSVKKDLMHFMMRYKMNTYLYGAKSDPYHSQYWQQNYPAKITAEQEKNGWLNQAMVTELAQTSEETKVNFIWAIHPGNNFVGSQTAVTDIMSKYTMMYNLGIRQFAVFVDDVGIPSSQADMQTNAKRLTDLQHAIEQKWNQPGTAPADTVRPLHFVPQIYCSSFASSAQQRQNFMAALGTTPSYITIYTTGQAVWSVPHSGHMANMNAELGRDMAWWWNYPCNDNADGQIYTMDMYSNFFDLPLVDGNARLPQNLTNTIGVVCNPMQEGEIAKTPLFSAADYTWNNAAFDNLTSWEASFPAVFKDSAACAAYRFLAPYLRWNDPDALNTLIAAYKRTKDPAALQAKLNEIIQNCKTLDQLKDSPTESDRLWLDDVTPWLYKLRDDCVAALGFLDVASSSDELPQRWDRYMQALAQYDALRTDTLYTAYALEGMGNGISVSQRQAQPAQRYLEPFLTYLRDNAMAGVFADQRPAERATVCTNTTYRPSVTTSTAGKYYMAANTHTYLPGEYMGLKLPAATRLAQFEIADTLYQHQAVIWSEDGRTWHRITSDSIPDGNLRYIIVVNDTDQPRSWKIGQNALRLTRPKATTIASSTMPDGPIWQNHTANLFIDGDLSTFATLNRVQQKNDCYVVDLGSVQTVHDVRVYMGTTNGDYMTEARLQVSEDSTRWFALRVKGVEDNFRYSLDMPQNVVLNPNVTYCDFNGRDLPARYVRLNVTTPNTSKWLRLYEIEVNKLWLDQAERSILSDADGLNQMDAIDGNGATRIASRTPSPLTIHLEEQQPTASVTLFSAPSQTDATLEAVLPDGTTQPLGQLTQACQTFDLSACPTASAVRLSYTVAPALYEVVITPAEGEPISVLTAIRDVNGQRSTDNGTVYDLQGRRVAQPRRGLYIIGNRKVAVK